MMPVVTDLGSSIQIRLYSPIRPTTHFLPSTIDNTNQLDIFKACVEVGCTSNLLLVNVSMTIELTITSNVEHCLHFLFYYFR